MKAVPYGTWKLTVSLSPDTNPVLPSSQGYQRKILTVNNTTNPQTCLQTERLILRPYQLSDAGNICELAGDNRVARETMNIPHPYERDMAERWIASLEQQWKDRRRVEYAITRKRDSRYIGGMSYVEVNGDEAEMGYWIGVPFWKQGYCTEAGRPLLDYGFSEMAFRKVTARHLASNPGSGRVLQKLGLGWKESRYDLDRYGEQVKFEFYETTGF